MFRIGTHTSIAGGPELAFGRSQEVGGNTLQIFAKSPRGRAFPTYSADQIAAGKEARIATGQLGGLIHSNYLINLSKPTEELTKEMESLVHDFQLAADLGYDAVNVHIGKMKGYTLDEAMGNMQKNLMHLFGVLEKRGLMQVQFLRENTAGQGSEIGSTIEEVGYFWKNYLCDLPVKFCFDTAHCRGGGIDLRNWQLVVERLDELIGVEQLYCIHFNDSKVPLGSKLDRHASLGRGFIGWETLAPIAEWAASNQRALYIETPDPDLWADEIASVRKIIAGDLGWIEEFSKTYAGTQALKKYATIGLHEQGGLF